MEGAVGIELTCHAGEIYGLLGPNGAGKTTTLRMLSTVLTPTDGTATISGFDVAEQPRQVRRHIGFLSGETGLYPRLTAREMIGYFGRLFGLSEQEIRERTDQLVEMLDMGDFIEQQTENLSTGMKQKVNIARTLIHDPPVLILDEPAAGLDVMTSRSIVEFILHCRDQEKCVLFSTHDMSKAERLCDRIGMIHEGEIRKKGTPSELFEQTGAETMEEAFLEIVGVRQEESEGGTHGIT